jgi:two-component system, OmpR family, alkaline phosphatase synthesis response regulator PhoP
VTIAEAGSSGTLVTIVEDDPAIAEGLALNLRLQGHRTETAGDAETALVRISESEPALVLLDITLPKQSGLWVLERLRAANNHVPVIVLSARQDEFDKVAALRLGADDYVTKPFALAELLARVAGVLRRSRLAREQPKQGEQLIRFGDVVLDPTRRTVTRGGEPVALTHREFELLVFLCGSQGRVFSRDELVRKVWGMSQRGQGRTVDNFVAQLRAKLEVDPDQPKHLLTVRGSGYRFVP